MGGRLYVPAVVSSILGIWLITYISDFMEPPLSRVCDLSEFDIEKKVAVEAAVTGVKEFKGGSAVLELAGCGGKIDAYLPKRRDGDFNVEVGDFVSVEGVVKRYRGGLEIVVSDGMLRCYR